MPITNEELRERALLDELALVYASEVAVVIPTSGDADGARVFADSTMLRAVVDVVANANAGNKASAAITLYSGVTVEFPPREGMSRCVGCRVLLDSSRSRGYVHAEKCPVWVYEPGKWVEWLRGYAHALAELQPERLRSDNSSYLLGWLRGRLVVLARRFLRERWLQEQLSCCGHSREDHMSSETLDGSEVVGLCSHVDFGGRCYCAGGGS